MRSTRQRFYALGLALKAGELFFQHRDDIASLGIRDIVAAGFLAERKHHQHKADLAVAPARLAVQRLVERASQRIHLRPEPGINGSVADGVVGHLWSP
jgi:hypothetical protein